MKREDTKVKVFRMLREKNHKVNIVVKLATSEIIKMSTNILFEVVKAPCIEGVMIGAIKESEG